ncbi:MAG: EpsI family protein [Lentisphaerales bacterium]|nr:EpsI family protein [Lentisphaerales bacterium]
MNASGSDRLELHPPEYCLTGAGWQLSHEQFITWQFITWKSSISKTIHITEMKLTKEDNQKYFYHWYSDGESHFISYKATLAEDSLRRLQGKTTNWFLFRIISDSIKIVAEDFSKSFTGSFQSEKGMCKF